MTIALPEIDELTPEEVELLRDVARGRSNAEIAEDAEIEEAVVGADLDRILATLQLRDRVHAVVYAHEHGLIDALIHAIAACAGDSVYSSNEGQPIHGS